MKNKNRVKIGSFWVGMAIVVLSHLYMLIAGLPTNQIIPHSILNLIAAGLFAYVWFK